MIQRTLRTNKKAVTDKRGKKLEESKTSTEAIEDLNETNVHVETLELTNKKGVSDTSLTRPLAILLVQQKTILDCMMILIVIVV